VFEYSREEIRLIGRGTRVRDVLRLAAMSVRLHLNARGVVLPRSARELDLWLDEGLKLRLRANDYVLFEIMGFGAYDIDLGVLGTVRTVIDIGANIGLATVSLSQRLPGATFVCAEPSPSSFALLEHNLRRNAPGARPVHAAATAEPTSVVVREGLHPALTRVEKADGSSRGSKVPGLTIGQLLDLAGVARVDLMKLDVEGAERELFDTASDWAHRVGAVLAEVHPPLSVDYAAEQLSAHGYARLALPPGPRFAQLILAARRGSSLDTRLVLEGPESA
jgi:FkbM family methyltransferase